MVLEQIFGRFRRQDSPRATGPTTPISRDIERAAESKERVSREFLEATKRSTTNEITE